MADLFWIPLLLIAIYAIVICIEPGGPRHG
jgi:hypothetical protein